MSYPCTSDAASAVRCLHHRCLGVAVSCFQHIMRSKCRPSGKRTKNRRMTCSIRRRQRDEGHPKIRKVRPILRSNLQPLRYLIVAARQIKGFEALLILRRRPVHPFPAHEEVRCDIRLSFHLSLGDSASQYLPGFGKVKECIAQTAS